MSSAAEASLSSTFGERRALAWAVAKRMRVSSVRAVNGEVCAPQSAREGGNREAAGKAYLFFVVFRSLVSQLRI